jgi:hypothetical protein
MVGLIANDKGGNKHHPLNETGGVKLPFSQAIHNRIAWIGQTVMTKMTLVCCCFLNVCFLFQVCNETAQLQQIAQQTGTNVNQLKQNCGKLNGVDTPYFDGGLVVISEAMTWSYIW